MKRGSLPYRLTKVCPNCTKTFHTNRGNKKFCSSKCQFDAWGKVHPRDNVGRTTKLLEQVSERDRNICVYCGANAKIMDHVIPRNLYGPTTPNNLVMACPRCDEAKRFQMDKAYMIIASAHLKLKEENTDVLDAWVALVS